MSTPPLPGAEDVIAVPLAGAPDGPTVGTRDKWAAAAAEVLNKSGREVGSEADEVLRALSRRTGEGVTIPALGGLTLDVPTARRGRRHGPWDIRVPLADPDPNSAAAAVLADLQGGATSVWLTVGPTGVALADLATVLEPVLLDLAPIALDATGEISALELGSAFAEIARERGVQPAAGGALGADPITRSLVTGADHADVTDLASLAELARHLGMTAVMINATAAHEAGAGEAGEIAYALAAGIAYLRAFESAGIPPAESASLIEFRFAATVELFPTIAKLRAARELWSQVLQECGMKDPAPMRQHAVTSRLMTTRYDPWVNMLRTTVATFAAGVGGADAVTTLPFDAAVGVPDEFGRRIARNVSHLLIDESHVAATVDPAGGAGAVEQLTEGIAEAAWARLQTIESGGGVPAMIPTLRAEYAAAEQERQQRIARRRQPITGVTEFANPTEQPLTRRARTTPWPDGWAAEFEQLRDAPPTNSLFLATLGPLASFGARASFVTAALSAIGISVTSAGPTSDLENVRAAYLAQPADVVVIAGSDRAYAGQDNGFSGDLPGAVDLLRAAGAKTVYLAGKPPESGEQLLDGRIALGDDLLELASALRPLLHPTEPTS